MYPQQNSIFCYSVLADIGRVYGPLGDVVCSALTNCLCCCCRMSEEVCKSERKMSDLHMELGAATFESWTNEHAAEVLVPQPNPMAEPML